MKISVSFISEGRMLEGVMYLPPDTHSIPLPGLLFEGSMTSATTQVTDHIAQLVADEGFIAMVLDHSFLGDSEKSALSWESPGKRIEDIKAAFDFLSKQESCDKNMIVGVGVSVGAEYLAQAVEQSMKTGERIPLCNALAMLEGPYDDSQKYVSSLDIPHVVIDDSNIESAVEELVMWVRSLGSQLRQKETWRASTVDWSQTDK